MGTVCAALAIDMYRQCVATLSSTLWRLRLLLPSTMLLMGICSLAQIPSIFPLMTLSTAVVFLWSVLWPLLFPVSPRRHAHTHRDTHTHTLVLREMRVSHIFEDINKCQKMQITY